MAPDVRRALERALLAVLLVSFVPRPAHALRFCNWNILNYPGTQTTAAVREPAFRTVLTDIHPDVLVVQEMQTGGNAQFLNNVLNVIEPGQWTAVTFHFHGDTDNAMFYKPAKVVMVDSTYLTTDLRDIAVYRFRMAGYTGPAAEMSAFSMHLKASNGLAEQHQRRIEAVVARNYANGLPSGTNFFYCGDMNVYSNTDSGYVVFLETEADNDGRAHDPLNRQGAWNNNGSFADVHTQSTRTGTLSPSDGGATGGLDDRFDQILFSPTMDDGQGLDWIPGTYKAWGNDGVHFNLNINDPPTNAAVGQTVANALQRTSDHLPVVMDLQAPALAGVSPASLDFGVVITGAAVAPQDVQVTDVAALPADELDFTVGVPAPFTAAPGPYQVAAGASPQAVSVGLDTSTPGVASGNLTVSSDDPENPVTNVALSGTILAHALPSLSSEPATLTRDIDWGVLAEGAFDVRPFAVYDVGYNSLQAQLELGAPVVTGGDGRFTLEAPAGDPVLVGPDSVEFAVAFHDSGATQDSLYEATVTIPTKDDSALPGSADQATLTVTLHATVGSSPVAVGEAPPAHTGLRLLGSNPSRGGLALSLDLAHDAEVRVELYDVSGRKVGSLARGMRAAGRYSLGWSARQARATRAGVYFVSYEADGVRGVERVVILP